MSQQDIVIMGIGNPLLMDDRAGIEVAERLQKAGVPARFEILYTVGFEVIDKLLGAKRAIIIDASALGGEPGTVHTVSVDDIFTTTWMSGSHAITLGATVKTGYEVFEDEMPERVDIILIEAEAPTEFCDTCTPRVEAAVQRVCTQIAAEFGVSMD